MAQAFSLCAVAVQLLAETPDPGIIRVHENRSPVNSFDPAYALGAGVDGHEQGQIAKMLSRVNIAEMRSAGLRSLSYRLRTELAGEAWHWNPEGRWSDVAHEQGYWVSDATSSKPVLVSYGYRLPRRGNTRDEANNDGYSRLDDGDDSTFWKSNPYLDAHFTGEDASAHPQWVVVDFGRPVAIDTLRVFWGVPYATNFRVEYSTGREMDITLSNGWQTFPGGNALKGTGGEQTIVLGSKPVVVHYLRIAMTAFSGTGPPGSTDPRDRLGVAIREIRAGVRTRTGFADRIRHARSNKQTVMYASSTDPWHRPVDRDTRIEQPGFDLVFGEGLAHNPMLAAVPVLYDVPENAANELRYLKSRGYGVTHAELGEEPEEQQVTPEDYGALYSQWSKALRSVRPELLIGGPSLVLLHADAEFEPSWKKRLFTWLREHNHMDDFHFFSFEWYPFDEVCGPVPPLLARARRLLDRAIEKLHRDGLPERIPMFMTEYGYSAYGTEAEVTLPGALLNAEAVAEFLTLGGKRSYLYGYEPNELINEKDCSWGNNMLFLIGQSGTIRYRMPTYYAVRLLTQEWASPQAGLHQIYHSESDISTVSAFALRRPDDLWSVLLINKDPKRLRNIAIKFDHASFAGSVEIYQYSPAQYQWRANAENGHPVRDLPPVHWNRGSKGTFRLPAYSITIVRGRQALQ